MRIDLDNGGSIMIRALGMLLFVAVTFAASDCQAQQRRGLLRRGARVQHQPPQAVQQGIRANEDQFEASGVAPIRRFPAISRYFEPSNLQSWDPGSGDPRYIGGFHYTHFQNIGIPSGDIGLRGNAYHWRPW